MGYPKAGGRRLAVAVFPIKSPNDGYNYLPRQSEAWNRWLIVADLVKPEAPNDNQQYARQSSEAWSDVTDE